MKTILIPLVLLTFIVTSCTVTNNLYINDPKPIEKGTMDFYFGAGTGLKPKIDTITENGDINFANDMNIAPIFDIGGQYGITNQLDLRFAMHLPYVIGGFGMKLGTQYSFFKSHTKFSAAIGTDLGFVIAKDSIRILGSSSELKHPTNGAISADFFLPLAYNFGENYRIILTPRFSFNQMYIRQNVNDKKSTLKYSPFFPVLTLGARLNKIYLEASMIYFENKFYPNFGLAYIVKANKE